MVRQTALWLFEGILLSLSEHNDISTASSTYRAAKHKKPSMSRTYPIKRSTTQTKANPIVYFRPFFTCCNKRENESEWREIILFVSEGRGSSSWLWTITSVSYMKIKSGPGSSNVTLWPIQGAFFKVQNTKDLKAERKSLCQLKKGALRGRKDITSRLLSDTSLLERTFKVKDFNWRHIL